MLDLEIEIDMLCNVKFFFVFKYIYNLVMNFINYIYVNCFIVFKFFKIRNIDYLKKKYLNLWYLF